MEPIIVAVITGGLALLGTVITVIAGNRRTENSMRTSQAVMESQLEALTREVRQHNHFAQRMPVVEEQIKVINHRLADLEKESGKEKTGGI